MFQAVGHLCLFWHLPQWAECGKAGLPTSLALPWSSGEWSGEWCCPVWKKELPCRIRQTWLWMCLCPYQWTCSSPFALLTLLPHSLSYLALPSIASVQRSLGYNHRGLSIQQIGESRGHCIPILYLLLWHLASVPLGYFLVNKTHLPGLEAKGTGYPGLLHSSVRLEGVKSKRLKQALWSAPPCSQGYFLLEFFSLMLWRKGFGSSIWFYRTCVTVWVHAVGSFDFSLGHSLVPVESRCAPLTHHWIITVSLRINSFEGLRRRTVLCYGKW